MQEKYKETRHRYTKIRKPSPERKPNDAVPSPDLYKTLEAFNYANSPVKSRKFSKAPRRCPFEVQAKSKIAPGPSQYLTTMDSLGRLSKGFSPSSKRLS